MTAEKLPYRYAFYQWPESTAALDSGYEALSLFRPKGPLVTALVEGVRENLSGQIAVKMALQAIARRAIDVWGEQKEEEESVEDRVGLQIVKEAFREANKQVYDYGHRMASGGKLAATGVVGSFDGAEVSLAKVGPYQCCLWRRGSLVNLYDGEEEGGTSGAGALERFIGANAQILVDLASVKVRDGDVVVLTSLLPSDALADRMNSLFSQGRDLESTARKIVHDGLRLQSETEVPESPRAICHLIQVGSPTIVLREVISEAGVGNPA